MTFYLLHERSPNSCSAGDRRGRAGEAGDGAGDGNRLSPAPNQDHLTVNMVDAGVAGDSSSSKEKRRNSSKYTREPGDIGADTAQDDRAQLLSPASPASPARAV